MGQRKIHQEDITHIKQDNLKLYDGKPVQKNAIWPIHNHSWNVNTSLLEMGRSNLETM